MAGGGWRLALGREQARSYEGSVGVVGATLVAIRALNLRSGIPGHPTGVSVPQGEARRGGGGRSRAVCPAGD